ncbi:hypothetical protein IEQ34_008591 [Dendrobium chrysotoxum]|uniref:Uncharacterized protein n=1 Tax=Dendrobium chrysotoxum TaxID=161865 RepID=A0AAV7GY75_DENCH|nr:hypothetical protein IEQ34_008591 [Dendrobium chrysotoxum]
MQKNSTVVVYRRELARTEMPENEEPHKGTRERDSELCCLLPFIFDTLGREQGNEMQIRSSDLYLSEEEELNFYEIILRGRHRKEIVIGYRLADAERAVINPPAKDARRKWSYKDVFIVITVKD